MTTQTLEATYRDGVLHLSRPLDLADGARVEVVVSEPFAAAPAAGEQADLDPSPADHPDTLEAQRRQRMEFLERIWAIPSEARDRSLDDRHHDEILYGGPDGAR